MNILETLLLLVLLIVVSAFVSCFELMLASVCKIKLQVMAKGGGDTHALDVFNMQQRPGSFITVVQIGLSAIAVLVDIVGETVVRPYLGGLLANAGNWSNTTASLLAFALVTGSFILIVDLMPKRVAMAHPEVVAVRTVRPMMFLIFILKPSVWAFDRLASTISKLFKTSTVRQEQLTPEDIYAVVDAGMQTGVLKQQEHHPAENTFSIQTCMVTSIMGARGYIAYFDKNDGSDTVLEIMPEKSHNRLLVCDGDLERVIGYIESRTLPTLFLKERNVHLTDKRVLRKTLLIPDTLSLYNVLKTFKTSGEDSVVVVNKYTLVAGVMALKDMVSIVMDEPVNTKKEPQTIRRAEDTWLMDGATPFADVMRALDIEEFPDSENYGTIAGFMIYLLRKVPERTDFSVYAGYKSEVIDTENLKIDQLLVTRQDDDSRIDGSGLPVQA